MANKANSFEVEPIAIVGVAFRFPGDLEDEKDFWRALLNGADLVTQVDPARWATDELQHPKRSEAGRSVTFSAGVLSRIDQFDADFFGISPREAAWLDPQQRLLLELAWEAMENGGLPPSRLAGSDCAVYVGISGLDYGIRGLDDLSSMSAHTMTGNTLSIAANRLSYVFDLHGPSMAIDTACSSSLVALHQACNALRTGDASMAMVGGVNMLTHPYPFIGFSKASMLSAGGRCRTFDAAGDGYVRAEGGAVMLLKPLAKAQADGDRIHAVILASGANADGGRKTGLTIPSGEGQIELMRSVLARAGIAAEDVDYLEAHGTGTAIGDPIETAAIGAVYGQARPASRPLPIGSVKTNLGHLEPASGMAGLVKALLVLKYRAVPPSIHLGTPNPKIDFANWNLLPVSEFLPLTDGAERPRIVGVNSFGFGGANAHVLLQEFPASTVANSLAAGATLPPLLLSARSETALRELAGRYAELLVASAAPDYYDLAYAAAYRRERLDKRLILAPDSPGALSEQLQRFAAGDQPAGLIVDEAPLDAGKLAFIYAGNGAQWVGMGQLLLAESDAFRSVIEDLDQRIAGQAGFSVIAELQADTAVSRMADTTVAQPLLFVLQVALTVALREQGIVPDAVAGHSVGEVAAAWAAGALTLDEAVSIICSRSAAQGLTRGAGRMAAVSMPEADMRILLAEGLWPDLEIAGINSPGNLTLSGPLEQLEALAAIAKVRGIVFRLLDLDYAFHSRCMDPVEESLALSLAGFAPHHPRTATFVSTVTGEVFDGSLDAGYWWDNVRQPVLFAPAIDRLIGLGCRTFVEISPHAILQRYLKECLVAGEAKGRILSSLRKNDDGIDCLQELVLRLHLLAVRDTLKGYFPAVGRFVDLPSYPWQRERHWLPATSEGYRLIERQRIHPLLGWPLKDAVAGWENILDPRTQPWLADHCVGGAVVLPGAAYIEMALAAARESFGGETQELEELDIVAPVVFDGEHGRSIRLDFNPRDGGFQIRSRQRLSDDEWVLNASGRLLGAVSGYVESATSPAETGETLDHETHYCLAHALGLDYGPVFQGMAKAHVAGDTLEGRFASRVDLGLDAEAWLLHPAIVDVCFQSLLDFFRSEIEAGVGLPLLPVKIGRLRLLRQAPIARFRTRILRRSLRSVLAEFELLTVDGETVAILTGCRFRAASLRQERQTDPACWEIVPVIQPGTQASSRSDLPAVRVLAQQIKEWFINEEGELKRIAYFDEAQPLFDALVCAFAYDAMQAMLVAQPETAQGWLDDGATANDDYRHLLHWVRDLLVEQAWLARGANGWQLADSDMPSAAEIWRTLLAEYPDGMPELVLVGRMGRALIALLAGQLDPVRMAADMRRSHQLETLFDDSISYRGNRFAVEQLLEALARHLPANRRLRILEISAGLSEVPRQLSQRIATTAVDYVLAHGDPEACDHLRHEYQDDEWITVAELETWPPILKAKTSLPARYDVVIFRHALNGMADPRTMLAWGRASLASGGLLVLAERYADLATDLVWGGKQLAAPQTWQAELAALGFDDIEICREPAGESSQVGAYLLLAKCGEAAQAESLPEAARWLLLAGDAVAAGIALSLQQIMVPRGQVAVGIEYGAELRCRESAVALLGRLQKELDGSIDHVLLIAGDYGPDDMTLLVDALNLVQGLSAGAQMPRLGFITRGGAPVDGIVEAKSCNPAHAALWGFGRVVMNEYPGLACELIDLPKPGSASALAELLVDELLYPDGESEVVLDAAARHVLRMQRTVLQVTAGQGQGGKRYRLDFRVPGQLRNLLWLEQPERELAADEIEVRPVATGLNFRDVMYVMGLLPDEAVEHGFAGASLGLEFSGVVSRVGHRVDEYAPGDAVMGFGAACFASHVVTRANALAPKPEAWSFEAAATVPTVFFTVYYALKQLANLQPGERILIHGAAGGVGIAAVQLARHLGAEVFATAGSDEKREFVALLGADHVFDSRSLAYADQILTATAGEGVDVVLNSLAGEAIRRNLQVLRPFGRFLELGKRDFFENTPIGLRPFKDNISYFGIDADQLLIARPDLAGRIFREVMALFRSGVLTPLPVRAFRAEQVVDAFRYMQQARQIGKVVVSFDGAVITPRSQVPQRQEIRFDRKSAYLVTGGISGFGLETARWLASNGAGQLVLLSRRGAATPGVEEAVASIEELGAKVTVLACDVTDRESLAKVLCHEDMLPLKGIFHAAMVIDDALINNLDAERVFRVLEPKIKGAWNLHELTSAMQLDHFMLYSSVTTYIGNPGQASYVAGNAWLEGLAVLRRTLGMPVTCIGWGPIGDAGYLTRNQAVKDSLASRLGAEPLSAKGALRMLGRALAAPQPNVAIGDFQFSALARLLPSAQGPRFTSLRHHGDDVAGGAENLDDFRALIEGKSPAEVQALVTLLVTQEVAQVLAVSAERIDPARSLHDLGLDSLMGVELALGLEKRFGIQVPAMMLNEGPTVERVTARIMERLASADGSLEDNSDLATMALGMAVQHGELVSREVVDAAVAEIEKR
ncbi:type I polyketide synthase [Ferribacterium limneticum]|uniref:type I polyketide synthase n=1 Tax=Ferribacterium limneticum TaxID=76259 RepID=UPI001CFB36B7|nr:type I polyketide synthase [Ferribacterium limneticum]